MKVAYQMNRPAMMERLRAGDLFGYKVEADVFEEMAREWVELAIGFANERGCIVVRNDYDEYYTHWWYLHRCPLGCLQLTTWDDDGPVGDLKIRKVEDLMEWVRLEANTILEFEA